MNLSQAIQLERILNDTCNVINNEIDNSIYLHNKVLSNHILEKYIESSKLCKILGAVSVTLFGITYFIDNDYINKNNKDYICDKLQLSETNYKNFTKYLKYTSYGLFGLTVFCANNSIIYNSLHNIIKINLTINHTLFPVYRIMFEHRKNAIIESLKHD